MRLKDSDEELIVVDGLNSTAALMLFRKCAQRAISLKEEEELLRFNNKDKTKCKH